MSAPVVAGGTPLREFIRQIDQFASGRAVQKAVGAVARELKEIHTEAFDNARSPEGVPWEAIKHPRKNSRPLVKSEAMRKMALRPLLSGQSVTFGMPPYGVNHQYGAPRAHIVPRPFLAEFPFSPQVAARLERVIVAAIEEIDGD